MKKTYEKAEVEILQLYSESLCLIASVDNEDDGSGDGFDTPEDPFLEGKG